MSRAERVLVLAPYGRDAALASQVLAEAGVSTATCSDIEELCQGIRDGAGLALVEEEALGSSHVEKLLSVLAKQPAWSDFPFLLLSLRDEHRRRDPRFVESANVTILERPLRRRTLLAAVAAALRARHKQYDARRAIQDRDEFLAMLGHELRNPLGAIRFATTILADAESQETAAPRGIIERQSSRLVRLVDDLLEVSRVTSGKIQLRLEPVDLQQVLQHSAETVAAMAPAAEVTVRVVPAPPVPLVADAARLEQVFSNLLANAIKYTPAGGRIDMEATVEGDEAVVRIHDTGIGIPEELLERIFDLFAQVETSIDRARGGMGIGLTLVKDLVELHGGTVEAASRGADQGTEFCVRLPRSLSPTEPAAPARPPQDGSPRHVVIVEDNDDIRTSFRMVLEMAGHTVHEAGDGLVGAQMIVRERPSAAFVDIGLPTMDGYEIARHVRRQGSETVLIAVTGYGQPADRQRALDAGFRHHLTKPVDVEKIERVLAELSVHG